MSVEIGPLCLDNGGHHRRTYYQRLRLTQSAQNKFLIIPITRSTWFDDKSLQTTTEKNWNLNFQTRGCIEIRDLSHYCGGRCSSIFEMSEKLVLFSEACYFCADFGLNIQATTSLAPQMQECPELAFDKHWKSELSWNEFINDILSVMTLPRIVC